MLRIRWLGRTRYQDADALQHALARSGSDDWLLFQEHEPTYTLGVRTDPANMSGIDGDTPGPDGRRADIISVDRGGDVTFHGPGQVTVYPVLTLPGHRGGTRADTTAYVRSIEDWVIDTITDLGVPHAGRHAGYPGVWVVPPDAPPRKIAAVGVRINGRRTLHGVALNVDVDRRWFDRIVPCGIAEFGVTSIAAEGVAVGLREVVDALADRAVQRWAPDGRFERADVAWRQARDDLAPFSRGVAVQPDPSEPDDGVEGPRSGTTGAPGARGSVTSVRLGRRREEAQVTEEVAYRSRKPAWMRADLRTTPEVLSLKHTVRELGLVTVCEEAGCPNLSECWSEGTATFMINGERCTRACGFCQVDTRHPLPLDLDEPDRVAEAVDRLGLGFAVLTCVARDDLADGGADGFVRTIRAIRSRCPGTAIEVLISDMGGSVSSLDAIFEERPEVCNHNLETVARLQRMARPSAGYARSLGVLGRAAAAGLVTKSGLVLGMGESEAEIEQTLADLAGVGVRIVTMGQYLRPSPAHLPVARWWTPEEFDSFAEVGRRVGIDEVVSSPFTRSSYHAKGAAAAVGS